LKVESKLAFFDAKVENFARGEEKDGFVLSSAMMKEFGTSATEDQKTNHVSSD